MLRFFAPPSLQIALIVEEDFSPFYDTFVAIAKSIIQAATTDLKLAGVRNKALEALSNIYYAVGKEKSGMDAMQVLQVLLSAQHKASLRVQATGAAGAGGDPAEGDSSVEEVRLESYRATVHCIARTANLLGADFGPVLPYVMPELLRSASQEISISITDAPIDGIQPNAESTSPGMSHVVVTAKGDVGKCVAMDSSSLMEKEASMQVRHGRVTRYLTCVRAWEDVTGAASTDSSIRLPAHTPRRLLKL